MVPETRYARAGDVHIAYQVLGDGPIDLVYVPPQLQQVEHLWAEPRVAALFHVGSGIDLADRRRARAQGRAGHVAPVGGGCRRHVKTE